MPGTQDILLSARVVHTGTQASANAILVRDGVIAGVGDRADLHRASPGARSIDLAGATLTPGLIDAHVHLTEWALVRDQPDLGASTSPGQAATMLAAAVDPDTTGWIRGRGWSSHDWNDESASAAVLDAIFPDRPVALQSHDMHSLWLNTAALRAIGVHHGTPDPDGGRIVRDANGEPTGILLETAAELVLPHIPAPTDAQAMAAVTAGQADLHRLGFTGVHSFPGIHIPVPDPFTVLQKLYECDVLRLRILQHFPREKLDAAIEIGLRSGFGNDWLRVGGVKLFLDGALGSQTAWMQDGYEGTDQRGVNVLERAALRDIVKRAAAAGISSTIHAIGDAAVSLALDELSRDGVTVEAMPHRIEHVQCCPPERLADFARANIVCSVQPCHLMSDWPAADRHWGRRGASTYAFRSLLEHGATLAFGSDAPVESIDPRRGLFAAVLRQDDQRRPGGGWYPDERIAAAAALQAFTAGPAFAAGTQGRQGILQAGAWADVAAWNEDPLGMDPDELTNMRCVATMVGGELVFS